MKDTTLPNADSDLLILAPSCSRDPVAPNKNEINTLSFLFFYCLPVDDALSLPARSTRLILLTRSDGGLPGDVRVWVKTRVNTA